MWRGRKFLKNLTPEHFTTWTKFRSLAMTNLYLMKNVTMVTMPKISRRLKTDRRANAIIKADVFKTKVYLQYNNFKVALSTIEAQRIAKTLNKALAIQQTQRKDSQQELPTPIFLDQKQSLVDSTNCLSLQPQNSLEQSQNSLEQSQNSLEQSQNSLEQSQISLENKKLWANFRAKINQVHERKMAEGLAICFKVANILKGQFPNEIMKIKEDTILLSSAKNKRKLHGNYVGRPIAYYDPNYYRVVIKQKFLHERKIWTTKLTTQKDRRPIYGELAIIELMCHELAHHRTSGHAKGFKIKYKRFFDFMLNQIISGQYYR